MKTPENSKEENTAPAGYNLAYKKADEYIHDEKKTSNLIDRAFRKAEKNQKALGKVWDEFMALLRMLKAYVKRALAANSAPPNREHDQAP